MSRSGEKSESSWNHSFVFTLRLVAALDAHAVRTMYECKVFDMMRVPVDVEIERYRFATDRHNR